MYLGFYIKTSFLQSFHFGCGLCARNEARNDTKFNKMSQQKKKSVSAQFNEIERGTNRNENRSSAVREKLHTVAVSFNMQTFIILENMNRVESQHIYSYLLVITCQCNAALTEY